MVTATNVDATAVNTLRWLAAGDRTIVVPVYQRQYRWDIGNCEQLLTDIRAVADLDDRHMHFIGSVLSAVSDEELVLIDGQQRITTLMLLVAALQHAVGDADPALSAQLRDVLLREGEPGAGPRTTLRPHRAWADVFRAVVLGDDADPAVRASRFADNYAFFRSQVSPDEAPHIWRGLQKLEHVAISLGSGANAQQIFESLNSTGEPLRDHELIHNYVLMGLSHAEQVRIEEEYWLPIEQATGESIAAFWQQYLVMRTGRESEDAGGRGVYDVFRHEFPRLEPGSLDAHAAEWREYAEIHRTLREPGREPDDRISRRLAGVGVFGSVAFPLVMRVYRRFRAGDLTREALLALLQQVESLLLRRTIVGIGTDRIVARLCRAEQEGAGALTRALARIMPSDERVSVALKYSDLPHPDYVLTRLFDVDVDVDVDAGAGWDVDHIVPLTPGEGWSGDGVRPWIEYSEDEQNSHRALARTLGNLVLIEEEHGMQVFDASFPVKRDGYRRSAVPATAEVAARDRWGTREISARSAALTAQFVRVWPRPDVSGIDDDGLTPVLDAVRRRGWPRGWEREWDYVEYRGEHWEVKDVRYLFHRVFARLWADERDAVVAYSARRGGPVYPERAWTGQWDALDADHHLYLGWDSSYMLSAVQGVLTEAGIAEEVFVKYSYIGAVMSTGVRR
ncbi:DUF262 domain-containing HNH endonuclease family protein [Microbacterium invictum]|uniref:DUF262 domain-containing HNH endonuclease family protein n=1 Tax=Microbacterium invictum TaxID=515415 RepID=A0ABZ0V5L9_9MICO|nr:DUF262 domain-containing HNH endonuclease family protein [Microbacterium invictum]WQB68893.1 DUF262 domain-containing HNH endonuclease family protein [Microbacterium invictum]